LKTSWKIDPFEQSKRLVSAEENSNHLREKRGEILKVPCTRENDGTERESGFPLAFGDSQLR